MYCEWCTQKGLNPLTDFAFQKFVFWTWKNGFSYSKANSVRSAVLFACGVAGEDFKFNRLSLLCLKSFKRMYLRSKPNIFMPLDHLLAILGTFAPVQEVYFCLLILSFFTLVRPAEILFLQWKHIDIKNKYISLPWSKNDPYGAGTYVRLLPAAMSAINRLTRVYDGVPPQNSLIFPIKQNSLNPWLAAKCAGLGLPTYTWYALKHGGATYLALNGWSLSDICDHGRWKSAASAKIYIHAPVKSK